VIKESALWIIHIGSRMCLLLTWICLVHFVSCLPSEKLESGEFLASENSDDMTFVSQSLSHCLTLLEEEGSGSEETDSEELSEDNSKKTILIFGSSLVKSIFGFDYEEDMHVMDESDTSSDIIDDVSDMEQNVQDTEARDDILSESSKTNNLVTSELNSWRISRLRTTTTATPKMSVSTTQFSPSPIEPVTSTYPPTEASTMSSLATDITQEAETVRLLALTLSPVVTSSVGQTESSVSLDSTLASTEEPKSLLAKSDKTGSENVNTTPLSVSGTQAPVQITMTTSSEFLAQQDEIGAVGNSSLLPQPVLQTSTPSSFLTQDSTTRTVVYSLQGSSSLLYVAVVTIPCLLLVLATLGWLCMRRQSKLRPRLDSKDSYAIVPRSEEAGDTSFLTSMTSSTTLRTIPDVVPNIVYLSPGVSMPNINKNNMSWETGTGRSMSDLSSPGQSPGARDIEAGRKRQRWQSDNNELDPIVGCDTPLVGGGRWRSEDWEKDQSFMNMMARRLEVVNSNAEITEL